MPISYAFDEVTGILVMNGTEGSDSITSINYNLTRSDLKTAKIFGKQGADTIRTEGSDDLLYGGNGTDILSSKGGENRFFGGDGSDSIFARFEQGEAQFLFGGKHDDLLTVLVEDTYSSANIIEGNGGTDRLQIESLLTGNRYLNINLGTEKMSVVDNGVKKPMGRVSSVEDIKIYDRGWVYGGKRSETIEGSTKNDRLFGGGGHDTLIGGLGSDSLFGNDGKDLVWDDTNSSIMTVDEGSTRDKLFGGKADDVLISKGGNDQVFGGAGSDLLISLGGRDTLKGGDGRDHFSFELFRGDLSDDAPNIPDYLPQELNHRSAATFQGLSIDGGAGRDMIEIQRFEPPHGQPNPPPDANDVPLVADLATGVFKLIGVFDSYRFTATNVEDVTATARNDIVLGDGEDNRLIGLSGADTLVGRNGKDELRGGAGADAIKGGGHADRIFGQDGKDKIDGGLGADDLFGGRGDDLLLGGRGNDTIGGNAGSDTLVGGKGKDVLVGGKDADIFVLRPGDGLDFVYAFDAHGADGDKVWLKGLNLTYVGLDLVEVQAGQNDPILNAKAPHQGTWVVANTTTAMLLVGTYESALDPDDFIF